MSTLDQLKAFGGTIAGAAVGALAGGPLGFGAGAVLGWGVDYWRLQQSRKRSQMAVQLNMGAAPQPLAASSMAAPAASAALPAGADKNAASTAIKLMLLGKPAEVTPARSWLTKFQASVGLPATGKMDPQTRTLLLLADPVLGPRLPATTILG